jgi:hypothetical protein
VALCSKGLQPNTFLTPHFNIHFHPKAVACAGFKTANAGANPHPTMITHHIAHPSDFL